MSSSNRNGRKQQKKPKTEKQEKREKHALCGWNSQPGTIKVDL
jgi:hypothetical protein